MFIYDKDTKVFSNEGYGRLTHFIGDPKVTYNNLSCTLDLSYHLDGLHADKLVENNIIKTKISPDSDWVRFTIYDRDVDEIDRAVHITAEASLIRDLRGRVIRASGYNETTAEMMIDGIIKSLDIPLNARISGNSTVKGTVEFEDTTGYEAIFGSEGVIAITGVEIKFTEYGMIIGDKLGTTNADEIRESDYVNEMRIRRNSEKVVTQIVPFTTLLTDQAVKEDDRYRKETIEKKVYGKTVTSPKVKDKGYPLRTSFVEYRNETLEKKKVFKYEKKSKDKLTEESLEMNLYKYEAIETLDEEAGKFFEDNVGIDEPEITVELKVLGVIDNASGKVGHLTLYDTVTIVPRKMDDIYEVRVSEIVYLPISNRIDALTFQSSPVHIADAQRKLNSGKVSQEALKQQISTEAQNNLINYVYNRQGERLEFGNRLPEPDYYKDGDVYFLQKGDVTEIYILKDGAWEYQPLGVDVSIIDKKLAEVNQSISQTDKETQDKLDDFKKQLEALELPDEDISRTLDDIERKLDRTSTRSDFALELIGSDGVRRYNKNILDGEYKRTVTLKEETTELVASGGFKKGQTYTISFEALCKLLERYKVNLKMTLPEFLKDKQSGYYEATIKHESNKLSGYSYQGNTIQSYVLAYEGNNALTISGDWYKTQEHNLTVTGDTTKPITLEYRDGLEDNLTDDLAINWATDSEVKFESSL